MDANIDFVYQNQNGLPSYYPTRRKFVGVTIYDVCLSSAARRAIEDVHAEIGSPHTMYGVTVQSVQFQRRVPRGLQLTAIAVTDGPNNSGFYCVQRVRMDDEAVDPLEFDGLGPDSIASFLPCPKCSAPLVSYVCGYVPGYQICTGRMHHHWLVNKHEVST